MSSPKLVICVILVGGFLSTSIVHSATTEETLTKKQCVRMIAKMDTVDKFLDLAEKLLPEDDAPIAFRVVNFYQHSLINSCLRSLNGAQEIEMLRKLVRQASSIHSVCDPDFTAQLLQYDRQIKNNGISGKYLHREKKHRLSQFFRLFAGQVVLTCKKSLGQKLELAEKNSELVDAVDKIVALAKKNDLRLDDANAANLSPKMRELLTLTTKKIPDLMTKVENIVLFDSLKPEPDTVFSIEVTMNSAGMLEDFMKIKGACKLIDAYARSSIYTIAQLAWRGYLARDDRGDLDQRITNDERIQKWIRAVQYCQGVLIVHVNVDLEQESPLEFEKDGSNEQAIVVDILKNEWQTGSIPTHRFDEITDAVTTFDPNIKIFTYSRGLKAWFLRRVSADERQIAEFIKLSAFDESFKQSFMSDMGDPEGEVQFGGTSAVSGSAFSHVTNHIVIPGHHYPPGHHMHYLGGSPGAEIGIAFAIAIGSVFLLTVFSHLCSAWVNRGRSGPYRG